MKVKTLALAGAIMALAALPANAETKSWTGFYIGAHGGHAWTDAQAHVAHPCPVCVPDAFSGASNIGGDGWHGGLQAGANVMLGGIVLGIEADASFADIKGGHTFRMDFDSDWAVKSKIDTFGTVRGRLGFVSGSMLIYATGGLAWGRVETDMQTISITGPVVMSELSSKQWHVGWTAGGGVEWAFAPGWSLKGEYLYVDLGSADHDPRGVAYAGTPGAFEHSEKMKVDLDMHIVRAGLNYRF
jgi:outer membrane immunogenic protein